MDLPEAFESPQNSGVPSDFKLLLHSNQSVGSSRHVPVGESVGFYRAGVSDSEFSSGSFGQLFYRDAAVKAIPGIGV